MYYSEIENAEPVSMEEMIEEISKLNEEMLYIKVAEFNFDIAQLKHDILVTKKYLNECKNKLKILKKDEKKLDKKVKKS